MHPCTRHLSPTSDIKMVSEWYQVVSNKLTRIALDGIYTVSIRYHRGESCHPGGLGDMFPQRATQGSADLSTFPRVMRFNGAGVLIDPAQYVPSSSAQFQSSTFPRVMRFDGAGVLIDPAQHFPSSPAGCPAAGRGGFF